MDENVAGQIYELEKDTFSDSWSYESIQQSGMLRHYHIYIACKSNEYATVISVDENMEIPAGFPESFAGYIISTVVQDETELQRIAVKEAYRGQGIGKALLEYYLSGMHGKCKKGFLEVRESNISARALYEKKGYILIGKRNNYYTCPRENGLVYRIDL